MLGVILWSDPRSGEAVIWCEDRAGLAYHDKSAAGDTVANDTAVHAQQFAAGDLVEFDLSGADGQRLTATNLSSVREAGQAMPRARSTARGASSLRQEQAEVIEFGRPGSGPSRAAGFELSRRG